MNRCNSDTDGIVRMEKDGGIIFTFSISQIILGDFFHHRKKGKMKTKKLNTKAMIMISMLGAIAGLLMFFELGVPFVLPFIKLDISELPVMLSGFLFGPLLGALSAVIKIIIKLLIKPTSTMYVGELSNLILSIAYQGIAAIIYRHYKSKKGAMAGLAVSTIATSALSIVSNVLFIFPFYVNMMKLPMSAIVGMAHKAAPWVNDATSMFMTTIFPFNILKFGLVSVLTLLIYKPLSRVIKNNMQ